MKGGGNCLKYLKKGVEQNRGGYTKILEKGTSWIKGRVP